MSKIAILQTLPTPADLRQSVLQIQRALDDSSHRLDATAKQVKDLNQLPELVADQVTEALKALDPILSMNQKVQTALEAFDRVNQVQRQTLESLTRELSSQAAISMELKTAQLGLVISGLSKQVTGLQSSMKAMQASTQDLEALPGELSKAAEYSAQLMKDEAKDLMAATYAARPRVMLTLGLLLAASVLGALLVAAGQAGLNRILPPTETQQSAQWAGKVWNQATESERKLLTAIASRPAQ